MRAFRSSQVLTGGQLRPACLLVDHGRIVGVADTVPDGFVGLVEDFGDLTIIPGLVDTHVHINEPGRTEWEGFETATQAAAAGGITTVVDMPLNCIPVTTTAEALHVKKRALGDQLWVDCGFWGGVTAENHDDLDGLLAAGIMGVKSFLIDSGIPEFSHVDVRAVEKAMPKLAVAGFPYLFHAEWDRGSPPTTSSSGGQVIVGTSWNDYDGFVRSRPNAWEDDAIRMLIGLCRKYRCHTHIVHLSSATTLPEIAAAKEEGLPFTVETCPHYLIFSSEDIDRRHPPGVKPLFKCCPPIRNRENANALWQGLADGIIDMVVSDHSPCTPSLKRLDSGDLQGAWGGIAGLQIGFSAVYTHGENHGLDLVRVVELMSERTARLAGLHRVKGKIEKGYDADFAVVDPAAETTVKEAELLYKHKKSPYNGLTLKGRIHATYLGGEPVFAGGEIVGFARGKVLEPSL